MCHYVYCETTDISGPLINQVGDRVAIDPNRPCHDCKLCLMGRTNICEKLIIAGLPGTDGGLCHYMVSPAANCHKLPDEMSLEAGACMEPMSIGLRALKRADVKPRDLVAILGAGTIGLLTMQIAKALGAGKVVIADIKPDRLLLAKRLGADGVFKVESNDPQITASALKELLGSEADLCIECSGAPGTVDTAIFTCRSGGTVLMIGIGEMVLTTHLGMAALREINIVGSLCNCSDLPECISLAASGQVDVMAIVTHTIPLMTSARRSI